jgi:steroid delta-isomerase
VGVTDLDETVREHCELFNSSFRAGDWGPFLATFTEDARFAFTNVPHGPFHGRAAIAAAYDTDPPTDTMTIKSIEPVGDDTARVRFAWDAGGEGTMVLRVQDGQVADLEVTFD